MADLKATLGLLSKFIVLQSGIFYWKGHLKRHLLEGGMLASSGFL